MSVSHLLTLTPLPTQNSKNAPYQPIQIYRSYKHKKKSSNSKVFWSLGCGSIVGWRSTTKCVVNLDAPTTSQSLYFPNQLELMEKVRKKLIDVKVEISPSAYDTAWTAMVPAREFLGRDGPCFEQSLNWVMENQNPDGSWGLNPGHPGLVKDSLSSTLACLLALSKWNVGPRLVQRGLDYIGANSWSAVDQHQYSPMGFDVTFPAMVNQAYAQRLTLPLSATLVDAMIETRNFEISKGRNHCLEYTAEGLGSSCNWEQIMKHQRANGSLFNSPATTAAAMIHSPNLKGFQYLDSAVNAFNGWVPTVYPFDVYTRVRLVDTMERLGVERHFPNEIRVILDDIFRSWKAKDAEIFSDINCLAVAFKLLRTNGYNVSPDVLSGFTDEKKFFSTCGMQFNHVETCLQLYRASQTRIDEEEPVLEKILAWSQLYLKQQLLSESIHDKKLRKEVESDLRNYDGMLDRVAHRQNIELYNVEDFQMLKTAYRIPTIQNEDFHQFSAQDFRISQIQYEKELEEMHRWYADCKLDTMEKGRNTVVVTYMFCAGILAEPEFSEARLSYAKATVLITVLDDFLDNYGSREESVGMLDLLKNWDKPPATFSSREVEVMFHALSKTLNDHAEKAYPEQGRCIKNELFRLWHEFTTNCLIQKNWSDIKLTNIDEYVSYAWVTIGGRICLGTACFFLGEKIPEDLVYGEDFTYLCMHSSLVPRLLNDIKTYKRESIEGVINSVSTLMAEGAVSEEEAIKGVHKIVENSRRKVLKALYQGRGAVSKKCKELMWKTAKVGYWLYPDYAADEFSTPQTVTGDMKALVWDPLQIPPVSNRCTHC